MASYSGFSHWKWWFPIAMLNYQRVKPINNVLLVKIEGPVWYNLSSWWPVTNVLKKPLYSSINQWGKDIYEANQTLSSRGCSRSHSGKKGEKLLVKEFMASPMRIMRKLHTYLNINHVGNLAWKIMSMRIPIWYNLCESNTQPARYPRTSLCWSS